MKKITILLVVIAVSILGLSAQNANKKEKTTAKIIFEETIHDYGEIELNSDGVCEFKFTNEGSKALILTNVRSSCGCTVPNWPKDPLNKDNEAVIKVKYNTARLGSFSKSITVYSNGSKQPIILRIKGNVINKKG